MEWSSNNGMYSCNPSKCKANVFSIGRMSIFPVVSGISQTSALSVLGVTFHEDCRFTTFVRNKLIKSNKFLFILRSRRVCLRQAELDYLFQSLIIPNLSYGLSVYGAVLMQRLRLGTAFLDRCHKRRYIYLSKAAQHQWLLEYLRMKNIKRNIQ